MCAAALSRWILGIALAVSLGGLVSSLASTLDSGVIPGVLDAGGGVAVSADYELVGSIDPILAAHPVVESADYTLYPGFIGQLVNLAPEAGPLSAELAGDGTAVLDLSNSVTDPDYDSVMLALSGAASGGAAVLVSGSVRFTPDASFPGEGLVPVRASDGMLASNGTIRIVDRIAPVISGNFSGTILGADATGKAALPDYSGQARIVDNSGVLGAVTQNPPPGTLVSLGTVNVTLSAADRAGNIASRPIVATVLAPPSVGVHPVNATVNAGSLGAFSVSATGGTPMTYQWRRNGVPIAGATAASYTIASVQVAQSGDYDVVVSNPVGSVTSNVAKLTVASGITISSQPLSQNANPGAAVTLSVVASGPGPITYQWRRNGVAIKSATAASYRIASIQAAGEGLYDVVVTNRSGSLTSAQATVAMNKPVVITRAPVALAVNPGTAASFTVAVSGTQPITYQWRKGTTAIPGATAATYEIPAAQTGDAGVYNVIVKNVVGSVTSASAALTLNTPVRITTQPVGGGVNPGASRTVNVVATGTAPLTYQWRRNGTAVAGGTRSSYTIAPAQESNVGIYDVLVGNVVGTVTSGTASVTLNAAPSIGTQPANLVVNPGKAAVFSVVAGGTAPLSYQWRRNGVNLKGATGATYTIGAAQTASAGTYDVVVKNVAGSVTSAGATLAVNAPVTIATQPTGLAVNPGAEAVFRVTANGTGPLTYQWRKGGVAIAGGTGSSYTLRAVQGSDAGSYDVVVGNPVGNVVSSVARLSVNAVPAITVQPLGGVLNLGVAKTFSVTATGTAPLGYQWRKNGTAIAGATAASYALGAAQASSGGTYDVVVSNVAGSVTSAAALVSVNAPPVITVQPGSLTVAAGGTLRLGVTASGNGTLTYQWRKGGVNLAGATGVECTLASVQASDAGSYDVVVRNAYGSVTSLASLVTLGAPAVAPRYQFIAGNFTWTQAKADAESKGGHLATITSVAEWSDAAWHLGVNSTRMMWIGRYQSLNAVTPLSDWRWVTGEAASFSNWASGEPNGTYSQEGTEGYVLVNWLDTATHPTGCWLNARNDEAMVQGYLLEIEAPEITTQPSSLTVSTGSAAAFSVSAFGGIPLSYQWRKNGVAIAGGTQTALSLPSAGIADAGNYDVVITNSKGSVTSAVATLTVNGPPLAITTQPLGANVNAGGSATFSVAATGTAPLRYQWRKDGNPVTNGTLASYALADIQAADAASYDVVVSDVSGSVTSASALLALNVAPSLSAQPVSTAVNLGAPATLSVAVSGTGPFTYQWRRDGVPVAGGTSASLTVASAQLGDAGLYDVVVTNVAGTLTSPGARLAIHTPASIAVQPMPLALNPGGSGVLTVAAAGTGPFEYQWRRGGVPIPGANAATFTLSNAQSSDAGSYDVVVSNVAGSSTSAAALVALNTPVSITAQPQGGAFNPGAPLNLAVTANGTGPLTYQWFKNGAALPDATGATFALASLVPADAGRYAVLVGNVVGNVTSTEVEVSVNLPVTITSHPASLTVSTGTPAVFTVVAEGTGPLTYQWRFKGSPIAGGTTALLAIGTVQTSDAGSYDVLVGNAVGSLTSNAAALVVNATATITSEPADLFANPGAPVSFSVTASGTGPFTYQWRRNGVNLAAGTLATLTLAAVQSGDVGTYDVQVGNAAGSVVSRGATLSLNTPVTIVTQPQGVTVNQGAAWSLSVTAGGTAPFTYQWRKAGVPVTGGTGATLSVGAAQVVDGGSYDVLVGNVVGNVTSKPALVAVNAAATIVQQPTPVTVELCAPLTLRVTPAGTGPFSYQWRRNGVPIGDAVGAVYTNPATGPGDGGSYDVVVTNMVGSVTSALAAVVVTEAPGKVYPPAIARQPLRALVQPGATLTLRVSAVGTGPLAYQWFRNGVALAGATTETYTASAMGAADMGVYCVRVSNAGGAVLSEKAQVAVAGAPGIAKDPVSFKALSSGTAVRLAATARGSLPFSYAWMKDDGTSVASGAMGANPTGVEVPLSLVADGKTMGTYKLVVWNAYGREESAPATVELALYSTRLLRHGWTKVLDPNVCKPGVNLLVGSFPMREVTLDDTLIVAFGSVDTHTYEWNYSLMKTPNPRSIPGQTRPYLALESVPGLSHSGGYILELKVTRKGTGEVWTFRFLTTTLKPGVGKALPPVSIVVDLNDAYVPAGGTGNFGVALSANGAQYGCTFNWYRQGLLGAPVLVGMNSTGFFSVPRATSADDADYFVVVADALGRSVESKRAHLWVFPDGD